MKVLIVANKGSNHAKKVAEGLVDRGNEVIFASPNDALDVSVLLDSRIQMETLPFGGKIGYILNAFALRRLYNKVHPDVVNVHYASGCGLLGLLAGLKPVVLSCYGSDIFEFPHINKFNMWILRRILKSADSLASTSHAMADEIRRLLPAYTKEIAITPFGINTQLFVPKDYQHDGQSLVVGIVKTLSPIYDIELLIRAFSIICQTLDYKPILRIYGDGPLKNDLINLCSELGISQHVDFCGRIANKDVPNVLTQMDVFVNCSKQESFGVNILEAMACGLPVVATDCVGPKELISDGQSGIIVKDRKPESLASAIIQLLNDQAKRKKMGEVGRSIVCNRYDWKNNILDLEGILNKNSLKGI